MSCLFERILCLLRHGIIITLLSSCATTTIHNVTENEDTYDEVLLERKNREPASVSIPILGDSNTDSTIGDPFYLRTQADYHFSLAESYSLEGQHQNAIESFRSTLIYDPDSSVVRRRLAAEYFKQGLVTESLEQAQEAVAKDPKDNESRLLLGGIYSSLKIYPKALQEYETILQAEPKNQEAPIYIGAIYSELKQYEKAVQYFQKLLKDPDYATPHLPHYYIGRVRQIQPNHNQEAINAYKKSLALKPDFTDAVISLSQIYAKMKNFKECETLLTQFEKINGPQERTSELLVQTYINLQDYDSAFEHLEILETLNPEDLNIKMRMALILIEKKLYEKASGKLETILAIAPDSDKVRFYLGIVYIEMKKNDLAIQTFIKLDSSSSFYIDAVVHAVTLMKEQDRIDEALVYSTQALKKKSDPQLYVLNSSLLDEKGMYSQALEVLSKATEEFPQNAMIHFYTGIVHDHMGSRSRMVQAMTRAIELDPKHAQAMNYLAFSWAESSEDLTKALSYAIKAHQLSPKDGYILDTLGWVYFKKSKHDEAIKYLELAVRYQPDVSLIVEHLGDVYAKKLMFEKAKKMYIKAASLEKDEKKLQSIRNKMTLIENQSVNSAEQRRPASSKELSQKD
jgi:tetratricopeptide (TPR) repeat protein